MTANSNQLCLVPSDPGCWLPLEHPVRFFNEIVEKELELSRFVGNPINSSKRGRPSYDPVMLLKIVLYGYMVGLHSSREMEQACVERIDFRFITGGLTPSFSTITKFRQEQARGLAELFDQSVSMSVEDDLVELKDVAFDGTKVLANASKHKAMSYERMCEKVATLHGVIEELKKERQSATMHRRLEIEVELEFKRERLANIQEHKFALEDEQKEETGEQPKGKDQRNFTDSESRIMKKGAGFEQCYNAQAAVDKCNQIILAAYVTQAANDKQQLEQLVQSTIEQVGVLPDRALADAGYFSEAATTTLKRHYGSTEWLISPGKLAHGSDAGTPPRGRIPRNISVADLMRRRLRTKAGKAAYAKRKTIVEPAFGQIKEASLEFRRFSFRGLKKVQGEWLLVCAAHNLLKIIRHRRSQRNVNSTALHSRAA
jgi:transposase